MYPTFTDHRTEAQIRCYMVIQYVVKWCKRSSVNPRTKRKWCVGASLTRTRLGGFSSGIPVSHTQGEINKSTLISFSTGMHHIFCSCISICFSAISFYKILNRWVKIVFHF